MKKILSYILLIIATCVLTLGAKQFTAFMAPMEDAMNPVIRIEGTTETEINCDIPQSNNGEYTFEVDYTDTRSTESYEMYDIPYAPLLDMNDPSNLGTQVNFGGADQFSPAINFFPFSFFDETTSALAIGENGLISFDPLQGGQINLRYPSANIPNATLTRNSIFASHYDLMIEGIPDAAVYYRILGTQPARKMVITFYNADVFYCSDGSKTSVQVVLEELTNEIQIYIQEKSSACGAITNAVVGIQDRYGNLGYAPTGRNYDDGDWTAQNEAYEFKPNGERTPSISWIEGDYVPYSDSNNIIGTDDQITVNADLTNLQYTVEIRYPNYRNELGEVINLLLTDDIQVSPFYPIALDNEVVICTNEVNLMDYNDYVSLNPSANFVITYYTDIGLTNPIPNPNNYTITGESATVYAQIATNEDCYDVATLQISSILGLLILDQNDLQIDICDDINSQNPAGVETGYALENLDGLLFNNINNGTINYYASATSNAPLTQVDIYDGMQLWVDVMVAGQDNCRTPRIGPIAINFYETPVVTSLPTDFELVICDENWDDVEDFDEDSSWSDLFIENGLLTNDPGNIITVYETEQDAINAQNALTRITMDTSDPSYNPADNSRNAELWIRVEDENGCFSIVQVNTRIRFFGVDAIPTPTFNICLNGNNSISLDLSCFLADADFNNDGNFNEGMFQEIFFEDGTTSTDIDDVYDISFHATSGAANAGINPIDPNQIVTSADGPTKRFYVRFTLCPSCAADDEPCYTVKPITFRIISTEPLTDTVDVCHTNDGDTEVDNLSIFNFQLFNDSRRYTITYYSNQSDAENQSNAITSYTFTGDDYLWIHVSSNQSFDGTSCFDNPSSNCEGVYRIRFVYGAVIEPIDFPEQQINGVCDNNADGEETFDITIFEEAIYPGEATFSYFTTLNEETLILSGAINNPTEVLFTATDGSATRTIYIRLSYPENNCFEIVRLTITLNFLSGIDTQPTFLCACLPTPGEYASYDLTTALADMFSNSNAANGNELEDMIITYHNFYNDAVNGNNQIFNTQSYQSIRGEEDIFVRFYSTESTCYSIDTLTLKNLVLPIPIPGTIEVCDTNINGDYDMFMNELDEIVMPNNTEGYYFSYYWNYDDALAGSNPIIQVEEGNDDPLAYFYEFENLPERIFVRVDSDNGECEGNIAATTSLCSGINQVDMVTGDLLNIGTNDFYLTPVCDTYEETGEIDNPTYNDGIASGIDLTIIASEVAQSIGYPLDEIQLLYYANQDDLQTDVYPYGDNVIEDPTSFTNMDEEGNPIDQVYIKVESLYDAHCPIFVNLHIEVLPGPEIFPEEAYYICPEGTVDIQLQKPDNINFADYSFEWVLPDGSVVNDQYELIEADQIGVYAVKVTDNTTSCSSPYFNFIVQEIDPPVIHELRVNNESQIEVIATGFDELPLEYSLDHVNYQSSNIFSNLSPGVYTVWVRYNYNNLSCPEAEKSTFLLKINNIITPNGDGYNDCITISNLDVFGEEQTTLVVYDRYGKVIFEDRDNIAISWCGFYQGRVLPSTSYWYKLTIPDGREKTGHFTLKNY